jgi:hypothetical protein
VFSSWIFDCGVLHPSLGRDFQSLLNHPTLHFIYCDDFILPLTLTTRMDETHTPTLHFIYCDDFIVPLTLTVRMDETRIDVTNLEDVPATYDDDISELQVQLTRITAPQASSVFSNDSARIDVLQSSPARSPLHLAPLSSDPHESLRSPFPDSRPTTAVTGLGIPSVSSSSVCDSMRDELFR